MAENEIAKQDSVLPSLPDPENLREVLEENLGGLPASFEVIKIPTGGNLFWSVPNEEGEATPEKELIGIVLHHYSVRAYWKERFEEGAGKPPDCSSLDGKIGTVYGECAKCEFSQFGTAIKQDGTPGRGQACQVKHRVFLLMPKRSLFPFMIPLSTMSATKRYEGSISAYGIKLAGKGKKLPHVLTKVKLIEDRNADGIKYAKAQFFYVSDLSEIEAKQVDMLKAMLLPAMKNKPIEAVESEADIPF